MLEFFTTPIAQDAAYHAFADQRSLLGVPNFWNVVSNVPFLLVGAAGFAEVRRHRWDRLQPVWQVFFAGIFLTAFGSGWYHLDPTNMSLMWDRLTMVIGFMGFVALVCGEYLAVEWGRRLVIPLLLAGAATVFYWIHTETSGAGDLRPYAAVQFLPLLLIPVIVVVNRKRSDLGLYIGLMIGLYVIAKIFEQFDQEIFAIGELLSGHSLKHVAAALSAWCLVVGLRRRRDAYL